MEAACELAKEGKKIVPEIMIPLVGMVSEMKSQKDLIREVAQETMARNNVKLSYLIGTMIELPRAAVHGRSHRRTGGVFFLRHERSDPNDLRILARRCRQICGFLYEAAGLLPKMSQPAGQLEGYDLPELRLPYCDESRQYPGRRSVRRARS